MSDESFSLWRDTPTQQDSNEAVPGAADDGDGRRDTHTKNEYDEQLDDKGNTDRRTSLAKTTALELAHIGEDAFHTIEENLTKNKPLAFFVLFSLFSAAMLAHELYQQQIYGWPPTELSVQASSRFTYAAYCFVATAIFGFILLSCRISSILLGLLYMFLVVLVINYGMLSISRGAGSLLYDDFKLSMEHLVFVRPLGDTSAQSFFDKIQEIHHCCGWGTDVTESWPVIYGTSDMIESCCVQNVTGCGKDAGKGHIEKPSSGYTVVVPDDEINTYKEHGVISLLYGMGFHSREESIRMLQRPDLDPNPVEIVDLVVDPSTGRTEKFLKNRLDHKELRKIDYAQTELDIHPGIAHIWDVTSEELRSAIPKSSLLYFSKGLIETTLFLDHFFNARCEKIELKNLQEFVPRLAAAYKNYTFYLGFVQTRMGFAIGFSTSVILMIFVLAVFFWSYFAKLKSEQLSDLSPPTDFDLLNLQLPTYGEVNELKARRQRDVARKKQDAINLEREIAHILVADKLAQVYEDEGIGKTEGNENGDAEAGPVVWTQPKLLMLEHGSEGRRPTIHELIKLSRKKRKKVVPNAIVKPKKKTHGKMKKGLDGFGKHRKGLDEFANERRELDEMARPKKARSRKRIAKRRRPLPQASQTDDLETIANADPNRPWVEAKHPRKINHPGKRGMRKAEDGLVMPMKVKPAKKPGKVMKKFRKQSRFDGPLEENQFNPSSSNYDAGDEL